MPAASHEAPMRQVVHQMRTWFLAHGHNAEGHPAGGGRQVSPPLLLLLEGPPGVGGARDGPGFP